MIVPTISPSDINDMSKEVNSWDTDDVITWVSKHVHGESIPLEIQSALRTHGIRGADLLALDREDVKDLGYTCIPEIRKVKVAIDHLKEQCTSQENGHGPNTQHIKSICPVLIPLLGPELLSELEHLSENVLPKKETEYWRRVHLMFILRLLVARTRLEIGKVAIRQEKDAAPEHVLENRLALAQELLESAEKSLNYDSTCVTWTPLMERAASAYNLSHREKLFMQLLVTIKSQPLDGPLGCLMFPSSSRNSESEGGAVRPEFKAWICGMSNLELKVLADEARALCLDRVLVITEDDYTDETKLSVSEEVCKILMGQKIGEEERLKLSGTRLLEILDEDKPPSMVKEDLNGKKPKIDNINQESTRATVHDLLRSLSLGADSDEITPRNGDIDKKKEAEEPSADETPADSAGADGSSESMEIITESDLIAATENTATTTDELSQTLSVTKPLPPSDLTPVDDRRPRCYTCELDYLNDQFALLMQQVQSANQRLAQDLKEASIMDTQPKWMRMNEYGSTKVSSGELTAKVNLARRKIELTLERTRKEGKFYPRLEGLVDQLGLDDFEKSVLLYLAGSMISPIFKSCIASRTNGRRCTVGDLLVVFCNTVADQVAARTYFYRTGTLVRKGLVQIVNTYGVTDLTDHELQLDRRVLDCIVGLDKESTEVVKGGNLYDPKVDLDQVVLPAQLKESLLETVTYFDKFRLYRKRSKFDEAITYGVGLTLMFCGPSGTGKTMTANAIAARLGKKLLLVNFPRLSENDQTMRGGDSGVQSIFREAELSDAIIFFDECESLFAQRGSGGTGQMTELLTELERFGGICFLATNRPFDLDEAMYRRISEVFDFKPPSHLERLEIWRLVTAHEAIPCDPSIEWESIALQFEITGGYIKNVVIAALLAAVGRNPSSPLITQSDIIEGCKKQMRGALQMVDFDERVLPRAGIDELVASDDVKEPLRSMVQLEKARGVLFGLWGFSDDMRSRQGTTALFWGPKGCGKSSAAEAVGFELGKALKIVDIPQLLAKRSRRSEGTTTIREVFKEARLMDAVLVLDGYSLNPEGSAHGSGDDTNLLNLLVREMARFPGVVIMLVDTPGSLDIFVSRLDKELLSGLKFLVEFALPNLKIRQLLWKSLLPAAVPTAETIKFQELARASEKFSQVQIGNAIYRAAAAASLRSEHDRKVSMKDLHAAISDEKHRGESAVDRWVKAQYL